MSQPEFTIEDLLNELAAQPCAEGLTMEEMAERTGRKRAWVNERIRRLARAGKVMMAGTKTATRIDGQTYQAPVYRVRG